MEQQSGIPFYLSINEFLAGLSTPYRTDDPDFYCLRLNANESTIDTYKAPFRKDFYFIGLVNHAGKTKISYDQTYEGTLSSFLVFQAPGLVYSFNRDKSASGYLIYFRKDCFSFYKPELENEFPFFDILHTNFYKLSNQKFSEFAPYFEDVFCSYEKYPANWHRQAALRLLLLFYQLKDYTKAFSQWQEASSSPQQLLLQKFTQLVSNFYIEKRSIEEYAALLHVTPNHLSQSVKAASGKNALSFITERLMTEASALVRFTSVDIAEIAYRLNFSDPANFGKFFKKHTGLSPLEFRKRQSEGRL